MSAAAEIRSPDQETRRGFTLLEVLAAVTVLGIWYFVLAALATDGLLQEGKSIRRLRAGLIADRVLAELEAQTLGGSAPDLIDETRDGTDIEGEIYEIRTAVDPFTLDFGPAQGSEPKPAIGGQKEETPPLPTLLGRNMPGFARHLYIITVEVSWAEGFMANQSVFRTSYTFDMTSAAEIYESEEGKAADQVREDEAAEAEMQREAEDARDSREEIDE